jgi:hypothetical protein
MMIADVELSKRRRNGTGHARIAMPEAEDATVTMTVDEPKLRVRIFEPNAFTLPNHDLKAHTLVVRELVGRDVLAKHIGKRIESFERLRGWILGHRPEFTRRHSALHLKACGRGT